ncbi:hypothetical protein FQN51_003822 [Onygenales sp. PD_10]|nr:hypothetical protein FQN51_003822 [Onygenales sp. PD_10]
MPAASNFPEPQQTYPPPQMVGHDFYPPQSQPAPVHSIAVPGEQQGALSPEMNYSGPGIVYTPQIPRFDVPTTMESLQRYSPAPQRVVSEYEPRPPIVYPQGIPMDTKPMISRIFNPYPDRVNWDFLGLES